MTERARHVAAAAALAACALAGSSPAAPARKPSPRTLHAGRPEDDPRLAGDAKAFARARVQFVEPSDEAELPVREEGVRVSFSVQGYAVGPAAGAAPETPAPHAHLIVDNETTLTVADATRPVFVRGIKAGPHFLRIVLCRPWHEVVKAPGAFALTRFWVGPPPEGKKGRAAELLAWPNPRKPLLTYVLPLSNPPPGAPELAPPDFEAAGAGAEPAPPEPAPPEPAPPAPAPPAPAPPAPAPPATAPPESGAAASAPPPASPSAPAPAPAPASERTGRAARGAAAAHPRPKATLDFYLSGAKLVRRGYRVRVVIDKKEYPTLRAWKPTRLDRLRPGLHHVTIDLLDRRGNKVSALQGRSDRLFSL